MLLARMKVSPVLPLFIMAHFSHHVATGSLTPLLPWLRDAFQLDYTRSGLLLSAFSLTYGFAQLFMANLADRWSKAPVIGIGLVGVSFAAMAAGMSPGFTFLLAFLILMGIAGSTYHAPASSFLSQCFPQEERGRALGTHLIGGSGSLFFTPVAAVLIAGYTGDWRWSFIALSIPAFFAGLALIRFGRKYEKASLLAMASSPKVRVGLIEVARLIGILIAIAMISQLVASGINSFLPLYLVDKHGASKELAGVMSGLVAGAGILGAPIGGMLSDRLGRKPVIMLSIILTGPMLYLLTIIPFGVSMVALLIIYGLFWSARFPTMESLIADTVPWQQRATALGVYFFLSQETAAVTTPVVGRFIDSFGPNNVFVGLSFIGMACSLLVLLVRKRV